MIETFLFDFSGNLYGRHLRTAFPRVHKDMNFHSMNALVKQMEEVLKRKSVESCGRWFEQLFPRILSGEGREKILGRIRV